MKKQNKKFSMYWKPVLPLVALWYWAALPLNAQATISDDQPMQTYFEVEKYLDLKIPPDTRATHLFLEVQGGDGGRSSHHNAGRGATVKAFLKIGNQNGNLPPGATIRLIPGKKGESADGGYTGGWTGGGGGGGSAVLLLKPDKTYWKKDGVMLLVAGGGGAGPHGDGKGGNPAQAGSGGNNINGHLLNNGGAIGQPGGSTPCAGGGASAYYDATSMADEQCNYEADPNAWYGFPEGGRGAKCFVNGGWGFGGGGSGNTAGGGGGGFSGGGAGDGTEYHLSGHGGGGGGSYIISGYEMSYHSAVINPSTSSPQDGYIKYDLVNIGNIRLAGDATKCIDDYGAGTDNGTNIQLYHCHDHPAQQWWINNSGIYLWKDLGKCIDLDNGETANGTNIRLWDCVKDNKNQLWIYDVAYQSIRSGVDFNKCMDLDHSNTADETNIRLWDCNNTGAQKWLTDGVPSALPTGSKNSIRLAQHPGKCVDISQSGTANGTNIQLFDCNGTNAQQFLFDGRAVKMQFSPNKCIDLNQSGDGNGTNIQLFDCNGTKAQQWIYDGFTGAFRSAVNTNKCLDVDHSNTANGTNIQLWDCNGTDAQRFEIN